jgi:hypothetical protein
MSAAAPGFELKVGEPTYCFTTTAGLNGCEGVLPETTSQLQRGPIGSATAAIVWPGSLAANAGSLIITAGGAGVPPQATMLNDPIRAEARTGTPPSTVTNTSVPNVVMKAKAEELSTAAQSSVQDLSVAAVGTIGSIKGVTDTSVTKPKLIVSKATSAVSDVTLAGVVHIDGITSTAEATSDGIKATVKGKTVVSGATIAGVPVTIDEKGITVQGSGLALTAATKAVNSAVAKAGLTLLVSEPQGKPAGANVVYTAGSLVAVFKPTADYLFSVTLGGANVTASAGPGFTNDFPTTGGTTGGTTGTTSTGGTTSGGTSGGGGTSGSVATGGLSGNPTTGGTVPTSTSGGDVPAPETFNGQTAASRRPLGGGVSPWLAVVGLGGVGLMAAGMKRLPDRVLEAVPPTCPLEES